jgi:hypothetical protein
MATERIDWHTLRASGGGSGSLTGELLARIERGDVDDMTLGELYNQICHQGTVGETGYVAVPIMARLAATATPSTRAALLSFVAAVARYSHDEPASAAPMREEWRAAFMAGIAQARRLAAHALADAEMPGPNSFWLIATLAALHGHGELAYLMEDGPRLPCPACGKYIAPNAPVR